MRRKSIRLVLAVTLAAGATFAMSAPALANSDNLPTYRHVFSIVEENRSFGQIIGNPDAPTFNRLASQYGLATSYFGTSHPSEPNYVAMVGGSDFGITDDGSYLTNRVEAPTLASQLEQDNPAEMQKTVPIKQLTTDLAARLLAFAYGQ